MDKVAFRVHRGVSDGRETRKTARPEVGRDGGTMVGGHSVSISGWPPRADQEGLAGVHPARRRGVRAAAPSLPARRHVRTEEGGAELRRVRYRSLVAGLSGVGGQPPEYGAREGDPSSRAPEAGDWESAAGQGARGDRVTALRGAAEGGYLDAVPPLPKVKVPESRWDFLTPEESAQVLSVTKDPDNLVLLLFALHTGARAGEQIAIEWGDVDWRSRKVIFRRSSTRGLVGPTKSGRERKVPMTGALERALKSMRHLRSQLVFCDGGGKPLKLDCLHERLWTSLRRAGLRRIRWHDLRHTFASQLMMAGVPIRQVQDWLGHSTITMTMRYAHL